MYTLYKSVNTISGKIFIGIESNSKIVNLNLDYQDDVDKIGVDMFNITILKSDISTIEDAYNKRNTIVKYLQEKLGGGFVFFQVITFNILKSNSVKSCPIEKMLCIVPLIQMVASSFILSRTNESHFRLNSFMYSKP